MSVPAPRRNLAKLPNYDALAGSVLLTDEETAGFLGIAKSTLAVWRSTGLVNLQYIKIGRCPRYKMADLRAFVEKRTRGTAEG